MSCGGAAVEIAIAHHSDNDDAVVLPSLLELITAKIIQMKLKRLVDNASHRSRTKGKAFVEVTNVKLLQSHEEHLQAQASCTIRQRQIFGFQHTRITDIEGGIELRMKAKLGMKRWNYMS